jgi:hypothetical protein
VIAIAPSSPCSTPPPPSLSSTSLPHTASVNRTFSPYTSAQAVKVEADNRKRLAKSNSTLREQKKKLMMKHFKTLLQMEKVDKGQNVTLQNSYQDGRMY